MARTDTDRMQVSSIPSIALGQVPTGQAQTAATSPKPLPADAPVRAPVIPFLPDRVTPSGDESLRHCRSRRTHRAHFGKFDAEYFGLLQKYAIGPPEGVLASRPLRDGKEAFEARLALVKRAERSIVCTTYAIIHDEHGIKFLEALTAKKKESPNVSMVVSIDIVANSMGSLHKKDDDHRRFAAALSAFEAAGGFVAWYGGLDTQLENLGSGDHMKTLVVDGMTAIAGGRNVGTDYVDDWTDFEEELTGPIAAQIAERALLVLKHSNPFSIRAETQELRDGYMRAISDIRIDKNTARVKGRRLLAEARARHEHRRAPLYFISWDPTHGRKDFPFVPEDLNPITEALIESAERATKRITLSSNYVWGVPELQAALMDAARRGVAVTVVTTGEEASPGMALSCYLGARTQYPALIKAGVKIRETITHEHGKMYVFDDRIAAFGSYNTEYSAHGKLVEALIFTSDRTIVGDVNKALEETITWRSIEVADEKPMRWWQKLQRWFLMAFNWLLMHFYV